VYDQLKDTVNSRIVYEQAITKDPANFDGYYRLGASYYNRAVDMNNQMNALDMNAQKQYDLLKIQRDALFRKALPYLERAHEIDSKDKDTMIALKELYARLNMKDKSDQIKKELDALQ
jgi:tetratricopeptide (TPR) repeat protein